MDYEKTVPFSGNPEKALEVARNVFIQHSFEIVTNSNSAVELRGTRTLWVKGQDPLIGISKVNIRGSSDSLSIEADFGVVRKSVKYLALFIVGMAVFFLVTFGILFTIIQCEPASKTILLSLAPFVPWPILIPLIAKFMKFRTSRALDALLHNMAVVGKEA